MAEELPSEVDRVFRRIGITGEAAAILMIVFGVLILVFPTLVAVLIGLYLIVVGVLQLLGHIDAGRAKTTPPPPDVPPPQPPIP